MSIGPRGYVSIAELIVYIPALVLAFIVCSRHGFNRASGFVFTIVLCLVRIIGSICQLLTYSNHSDGLLQATIVIDSIGISPLLLATLGMLSRFADWTTSRDITTLSVKHFRVVQLLITLGLILSIVGGTDGTPSSTGTFKPSTISQVAIILYIVAFAAMACILVVVSQSRSSAPSQEGRILIAVAVASPFIMVRLLYSILALFIHNHTFSIINGSVPVFVCMTAIEEFVVVVDYLLLGFSLEKLEPGQKGDIANRPWKGKKQNKQRSQRRGRERQYDSTEVGQGR
ncbi:hypothetical protein AK830_g3894 [Neonectria ditissima]|uniref:DUF7702 domain-containing protein n=1 Tax=Neonectria ditissima TaxID=78410 RepID=A0A0P7BAP2_9HYPO|nr:hypothetical protein AK830_g3894 [Neonectria ditissima]